MHSGELVHTHTHTHVCTDEKCYCSQSWKKSKWRGWVSSEVHSTAPPLSISSISLTPFFFQSSFSLSLTSSSSLCSSVNKRAPLAELPTESPHTHSARWLPTLPHALSALSSSAKTSPLLRANPPFISFVFPFFFFLKLFTHCLARHQCKFPPLHIQAVIMLQPVGSQ